MTNSEAPKASERPFVEAPKPEQVALEALLSVDKHTNRMILIGAPGWVKRVIHLLHAARITEIRDWSRLMPTRKPNEVISLMQRPRVDE